MPHDYMLVVLLNLSHYNCYFNNSQRPLLKGKGGGEGGCTQIIRQLHDQTASREKKTTLTCIVAVTNIRLKYLVPPVPATQ